MNELFEMLSTARDEENAAPTPPDVLAHTPAGNICQIRRRQSVQARRPRHSANRLGIKGEGLPHIVLDIFEPTREIPAEYNGGDARWPDMRVACEARGDIVTFLGESYTYRLYDGPVAQI